MTSAYFDVIEMSRPMSQYQIRNAHDSGCQMDQTIRKLQIHTTSLNLLCHACTGNTRLIIRVVWLDLFVVNEKRHWFKTYLHSMHDVADVQKISSAFFFFQFSRDMGEDPTKVPMLTLRNHVQRFTWSCDIFNMRKGKVSQFHLFGIDCSVLLGTDPMKPCKQFVKKAPCRLVVVL